MEDKKVLDIVSFYERSFKDRGIPDIKYYHNRLFIWADDVLSHCHSMLKGIKEFISLGDKEKRDRALIRLGFIQGCLAALSQNTVGDLKNLNRPDEGTINPQTNEPLTHEDFQDWEY